MASTMYWLDVDADRTGVDILVNGVSAEHLRATHGLKLPINEFLLSGPNRIEVRRGLWESNRGDDEDGEITIKLTAKTFSGQTEIASEVLVDQTSAFPQAPPRASLATAGFTHAGAASLSLDGLEPIGPREQEMILDTLGAIAAMWRAGDGDALVAVMTPYLTDYTAAYPLESAAGMADRVRRMAAAFSAGTVRYDRQNTALLPLGDGRLVDCLSRSGAAVRVERGSAPAYDMWTVMGVRGGRVQLIR